MLFDTEAEYKAEITETRELLKAAMKRQSYTSGGPGSAAHEARGEVGATLKYLELLSKELETLQVREADGSTAFVQFERTS
jgi:hypothetical protein